MRKRRIVATAVVGNIVEYYDFGLFAVYAAIIGKLFFPMGNQFLETLAAFATFAIGFFMRPLGGLVFGYIGDKLGRKTSLTISILGMAFCTFGIGILPQYETIGIAAPLLLLIIRMCQGLCVGGEGAGVAIFVLEHFEGYRPGFIGSIVMTSNMVGTLLAMFVGIAINQFCQPLYCGTCLQDYCWRYAFIGGGLTGLIGLYLRYQLDETPEFIKKKNSLVKHPIVIAFKKQFPSVLVVMFLGGVTSVIAYTIRGYLNVFFFEVMHYTETEALCFTTFGLLVMIILLPLFGLLSDKIGNKKLLYIICYTTVFTIVPCYYSLANMNHDIKLVFLALGWLGLLAAGVCAPAYSYAIKSFEVELRYSGVAVSWNIGLAMLGGTTPMISRYLSEKVSIIAPAYYIASVAFAFIIISILTRNHHKS